MVWKCQKFVGRYCFNQWLGLEQDVRKVTTSEVLDSLDVGMCFAKLHGDKQMNVMLNELIGKVESYKTLDKVLSICFLIIGVVS